MTLTGGNMKYWQRNLSHRHFVQHKCYMDWPVIEPGYRRKRPATSCLNCDADGATFPLHLWRDGYTGLSSVIQTCRKFRLPRGLVHQGFSNKRLYPKRKTCLMQLRILLLNNNNNNNLYTCWLSSPRASYRSSTNQIQNKWVILENKTVNTLKISSDKIRYLNTKRVILSTCWILQKKWNTNWVTMQNKRWQ